MDLKGLFIVLLFVFGAIYLSSFITADLFTGDESKCDDYKDYYDEDEYSVSYGERTKAITEGCL